MIRLYFLQYKHAVTRYVYTFCSTKTHSHTIPFSSTKLGSIESVVNFELKLASKWLKLNKLSLNADKTKLIFFCSKQHPLNYNQISIKFNGVKLMPVDHVKYLGIY